MNQEEKLTLLSSLFIALLILTNLMGAKITAIGSVQFSVALFAFPFTFLITDVIAEVKGREVAVRLVRTSFMTLVFVLFMASLFIALPLQSVVLCARSTPWYSLQAFEFSAPQSSPSTSLRHTMYAPFSFGSGAPLDAIYG